MKSGGKATKIRNETFWPFREKCEKENILRETTKLLAETKSYQFLKEIKRKR